MDDIDRMVIKQEQDADDELAADRITEDQHRKWIKDIHNDAQAELEARAQEAYDNIMGRW